MSSSLSSKSESSNERDAPHESIHNTSEVIGESKPQDELTKLGSKTKKFFESDAGDGTKREDHYMQGSKLWISYISLLFVTILVSIDMTITMSILTVLTDTFNAPEQVTWIAGAFSLGSGISLQAWTTIALITGRKNAMLVAIFIFEIGSLICALSTSMNMLIAGRTIQGIGAGGSQGLVAVIITEIFPINKRSLAMSIYTAVFGCMSIFGPFIGGGLEKVTWRWCFYINLPIGGVAAIIFFVVYNPPKPVGPMLPKIKNIDFVGMFLYFAGFSIFLVGITMGGSQFPWKSATVICCIIFGALGFFGFLYWNYKFSHSRIIPVDVLTTLQVQLSFFGFVFLVGSIFSLMQFLSIYFEQILGKSPFSTGVALLPLLIPTIIVGVLIGIMLTKFRYLKPYHAFSYTMCSIGAGIISTFNEHTSLGKRIGLLILVGIGFGSCAQPLFLLAQIHAPKSQGGTVMASTYILSGRQLGVAIQAAISEIVYTTLTKNKLSSSSVIKATGYTANQILNTAPMLNSAAEAVLNDAYLIGIKGVCYYCAGCIALYGIIMLVLTKNDKVPTKNEVNQSKKDREQDDNEKAMQEALEKKETVNQNEVGKEEV